MARWLTYIKERFPVATYLLLVGAMLTSGATLYPGWKDHGLTPWLWSAAGLFLFFFELRLMDELKDFKKDQIAHPDRPLPRGLLSLSEVRRVLLAGIIGMVLLSIALAVTEQLSASLVYLGCTAYLALMFKEFFIGHRLGEKPFLYGVTHQVILIPLMAFPVSLFSPSQLSTPRTLFLGITALGGFFTYELCRKLNPNAHPILKTYPQVYGPSGTLLRILVVGGVGIIGALLLEVDRLCVPFMSLTLVSAVAWRLEPRLYKVVEILATIGLLVFLACIPLSQLFSAGA